MADNEPSTDTGSAPDPPTADEPTSTSKRPWARWGRGAAPADEATPEPKRRWVRGAALVGAGLIAGGILAGTVTAIADDDNSGNRSGSDGSGRGDGDGGGRGDEEALTGDIATQVEEAALAEYPDATVIRLETDSDGVYEAHLETADGTRVTVEVDESFTVTGEE